MQRGDVLLGTVLPALGASVALLARSRRAERRRLEARLAAADAESRATVRRATSEERRRIAASIEAVVRRDVARLSATAADAGARIAARDGAAEEDLRRLRAMASASMDELRELLRASPAGVPTDHHDTGYEDAVGEAVRALRERGVQVRVIHRGDPGLTPPGPLLAVARVVRDVLSGARGTVQLRLEHRPGTLALRLTGSGAPPALADPATLVAIRERVRLHGGALSASVRPWRWRVRAAFPVATGRAALRRLDPAAADLGLALFGSALIVVDCLVLPVRRPGLSMAIGIPCCALPLAVRRRYPLAVCASASAGLLTGGAMRLLPAGPAAPYFVVTVVPFAAAAHAATVARALAGVALTTAAAVTASAAALPDPGWPDRRGLGVLAAYGGLVGAAAWYARHHHGQALALAADEAVLQQRHPGLVREALSGERRRVAHDLHDIVTHAITLCAVLAGAGATQVRSGEWAGAARSARTLAEAARQAEVELERLASALDLGAPDAAPRLGDVAALAELARGAGHDVTLRMAAPDGVPAPVAACAYRVVQEALTNARRHAGAPPTTVAVRAAAGALEVEVRSAAALRESAGGGSGRGLAGLRERAEALGGTCAAGPLADGGFRVAARLPLA